MVKQNYYSFLYFLHPDLIIYPIGVVIMAVALHTIGAGFESLVRNGRSTWSEIGLSMLAKDPLNIGAGGKSSIA